MKNTTLNTIFLFHLLTFSINAHDFDAIINLGGDCQVAHQLRVHGLRKYASPFDSLITPYESLQNILEHSFQDFLEQDNFILIGSESPRYILDRRYGTRLIHDCRLDEHCLDDFPTIAAKYTRRIERFLKLVTDSEYPLFIRKRITKQQTIQLRDLLLLLRWQKPFMLLVLDGSEDIKMDWNIEYVRNYHLRQPEPYTWKGDPQAWLTIFLDIGLEPMDSSESAE